MGGDGDGDADDDCDDDGGGGGDGVGGGGGSGGGVCRSKTFSSPGSTKYGRYLMMIKAAVYCFGREREGVIPVGTAVCWPWW